MKTLNRIKFKTIGIFLFSMLLVASCSKDDNGGGPEANDGFDGSQSSIETLLGGAVLDSLIDLGMEIHYGSRPPIVEGQYRIDPTVLEASSVPGDWIGMTYNSVNFSFSNQNPENLQVTFDAQEDLGYDHEGSGSFISGNDNSFSVFLVNESELGDGYIGETIFVITGTIVENGLTDFQIALYMVDNAGHIGSIPNDTGRIFIDGDGLVAKL